MREKAEKKASITIIFSCKICATQVTYPPKRYPLAADSGLAAMADCQYD